MIELADGSTVIFDQNLGWYDSKERIVEGTTLAGWHDTTALDRIERAQIIKTNSDYGIETLRNFGITLLVGLVLGIILIKVIYPHGFTNGPPCLVFIAVWGITTTAAAILIFA